MARSYRPSKLHSDFCISSKISGTWLRRANHSMTLGDLSFEKITLQCGEWLGAELEARRRGWPMKMPLPYFRPKIIVIWTRVLLTEDRSSWIQNIFKGQNPQELIMELKKSKTLKEDQGCYLLLFYHWVKNLDRAQWR